MSEEYELTNQDRKKTFVKRTIWIAYFIIAGAIYAHALISEKFAPLPTLLSSFLILGFIVFVAALIYAFMEGIID